VTYGLIYELSSEHSVSNMCEVLKVSRSGYYAYLSRLKNEEKGGEFSPRKVLGGKVKAIFKEHKGRYGKRRIQSVLADKGYNVSLYLVSRLMREQSLKAIQPKSFVPRTTISHPWLKRKPNLLLEFEITAPNQVIVGDITYLLNTNGDENKWLYLAVWMDLYSRKIVGWSVDCKMEVSLVFTALEMAIGNRKPPKRLIVHSDGGGQYNAQILQDKIGEYGYYQSMTRRDNHYDNAFIESLFSRFKTEFVNQLEGKGFKGLDSAKQQCFQYIEGYYNTVRKHSSLGYLSPLQYEAAFYKV